MIQKLGPLRDVFAKLPMLGEFAEQVDERELVKVEALIHSMTPGERARPEMIDKSRAARIARGSGRRSKEVRELVGRFEQMREMMAALGGRGGGLLSRIPGLGRGGALPDPSALLGGPRLAGPARAGEGPLAPEGQAPAGPARAQEEPASVAGGFEGSEVAERTIRGDRAGGEESVVWTGSAAPRGRRAAIRPAAVRFGASAADPSRTHAPLRRLHPRRARAAGEPRRPRRAAAEAAGARAERPLLDCASTPRSTPTAA